MKKGKIHNMTARIHADMQLKRSTSIKATRADASGLSGRHHGWIDALKKVQRKFNVLFLV